MRRLVIFEFLLYHAPSILERHFEQLPLPLQEVIVDLGLNRTVSVLGLCRACLYFFYYGENCRISCWREGPCGLDLPLCALHNGDCVRDRFSFQI